MVVDGRRQLSLGARRPHFDAVNSNLDDSGCKARDEYYCTPRLSCERRNMSYAACPGYVFPSIGKAAPLALIAQVYCDPTFVSAR